MYLVLVCLRYLRLAMALVLVFHVLATCGHREGKYDGDENYDVRIETFAEPEYLRAAIYAFDSEGIGYAAQPLYTKEDYGYSRKEFILHRSRDRGRTWEAIGKRQGNCVEISTYKDYIYFVVYYYDYYKKIDAPSEILRCSTKNNYKLERVSRFDREIYEFHVFNDSTYACGMYLGDDRDTLLVTKDSGKTWEEPALPGNFGGDQYLAYDGNNVYVALFMNDGSGQALMVKDIVNGKETIIPFRSLYSIAASGNLFTANPDLNFYHYDGDTMEEISSFRWNPWQGSYHPISLVKRGDFVVCRALQFPGETGKKDCLFGSVDGGYHWKSFLMGDDMGFPVVPIGDADDISAGVDSLSVFFTNGKTLNVLTLKKKSGKE